MQIANCKLLIGIWRPLTLLAALMFGAAPTRGQESSPPSPVDTPAVAAESSNSTAATAEDPAAKEAAAKEAARKRKLRIALLTGGLVGATGLALLGFTMLGGAATRRGLRRKPQADDAHSIHPLPANRFDEPSSPVKDAAADPPNETA